MMPLMGCTAVEEEREGRRQREGEGEGSEWKVKGETKELRRSIGSMQVRVGHS